MTKSSDHSQDCNPDSEDVLDSLSERLKEIEMQKSIYETSVLRLKEKIKEIDDAEKTCSIKVEQLNGIISSMKGSDIVNIEEWDTAHNELHKAEMEKAKLIEAIQEYKRAAAATESQNAALQNEYLELIRLLDEPPPVPNNVIPFKNKNEQ